MKWLALLLFIPFLAWAEHIDFSHAVPSKQGAFIIEGKALPCVLVEQAGKKYFVVFDQEGEYQQWEILSGNEIQLVWTRDMI
ncbi:MAG: hypothetical protein WA058_03740 [Minisyncoccia bacterium]